MMDSQNKTTEQNKEQKKPGCETTEEKKPDIIQNFVGELTANDKDATEIGMKNLEVNKTETDDTGDNIIEEGVEQTKSDEAVEGVPVAVKVENEVDETDIAKDDVIKADAVQSNNDEMAVEGGAVTEKGNDGSTEPDEYLYTKREGFTSELFKISVTNLPKKFGFAEFKKKLIQLNLKPVKLKLWKEVCFVTFRNEEDRETALTTLNGYKWKGHNLNVVTAKPAADPLMRKRKQEQNEKGGSKDGKKLKMEDDGLSPTERLKNSVTPLWKLSYEEQLKKKEEEMCSFMKKYMKQLEKNCYDLKQQLCNLRKQFGGMPCELQKIKPSPETEGYRNKCEFTIGPGINGETNVVGFRFGQYSQGTVFVGSPEEISFLSPAMKTVVKNFQLFLSESKYREFNPENHTGHWRQIAVRTSRLGHIMAMIDFHPQNLAQEEIDAEQDRIRQYFTEGDGKSTGITSCYFRVHTEKMTGASSDVPFKLVFGEECITERLLEMEFRISPNAFFQVNTGAAEVLYKQVADWCGITPTSTVLDVCCGTGTIGLTVAKTVDKVVGIEMCSEAIQDAKINAEKNGVKNVTYHCAKAEDVMKDITRSVRLSTDVVAIVDPPRSGLHSSVVVAIRNCRSINRLVYVSCNVNGALNNLIDLVRPTSKRLKGSRFLPVKAVPVDLFPHTNHCELVILFEREHSDNDSDVSI